MKNKKSKDLATLAETLKDVDLKLQIDWRIFVQETSHFTTN
jgi:hypothetical protein